MENKTPRSQKWILALLVALVAIVAGQSIWLYKLSSTDGPKEPAASELTWEDTPDNQNWFAPPPALPDWDPFADMQRMRQEMDQLFGNVLNRFAHSPRFEDFFDSELSLSPRIDFEENDDYYHIKVDLPGVESSQVDVRIDGQTLTIEAETRIERETSDASGDKILRRERHEGRFVRHLVLDEPVEADGMEQSMENGVLEIRIPKAKQEPKETAP